MKTINLNSLVTVELTPLGHMLLQEEYKRVTAACPKLNISYDKAYTIKDNKIELTLWRVMELFGQYLSMGRKEYPINLNIAIRDEDIDVRYR